MDFPELVDFIGPVFGITVTLVIAYLLRSRGGEEEAGEQEQAKVEETRAEQLPDEASHRTAPAAQPAPGTLFADGLTLLRNPFTRRRIAQRERDEKLRPYIYPGKGSANRTIKHRRPKVEDAAKESFIG